MKKAKYIIFRYLTSADFFNIYKPSGTEEKGGGQAYIDFPTKSVSLTEWGQFFDGADSVYCDTGKQGPSWDFPIKSIGIGGEQELKIYQRRQQSVCIASQRITSQQENRVNAWRPEGGFPKPADARDRSTVPKHLMIFIVRTVDDEFWAGWSQEASPATEAAFPHLRVMLDTSIGEGHAGFLEVRGKVKLDPTNDEQPFSV